MILARYVVANFFGAAGIVLLLLLILFSFLNLADALDDVGKGTFSTADAIATVILTTPARIVDLLPVVVLLGSVLGLGAMANRQELTAIRAAGVSVWQLSRVLAIIVTVISVLAVAMQMYLIPLTERQAQDFRSRMFDQTERGGNEFWSRRGHRIIRVGIVEFGRIPREIEIYELDTNGRLLRMLRAEKADVVSASTWLLYDVEEQVLEADAVLRRFLPNVRWDSFLSAEQLSTLIAPSHSLSSYDLYHYIRASEDSGLDTREHEALFWQQVSLPLALFAMGLLGLPLVLGGANSRSTGARTVFGAAVGVAFYLFEQITSHVAILIDLQPAATALAPAALVLCAALVAIRMRAGAR